MKGAIQQTHLRLMRRPRNLCISSPMPAAGQTQPQNARPKTRDPIQQRMSNLTNAVASAEGIRFSGERIVIAVLDRSSCYENPGAGVMRMSKAARSLFVFGIYLVLLGLFLLIAPNVLITLFGLPSANDVWIRVVGMLLVLLAYYDIQSARKNLIEFFRWSVVARLSVIVFFAVFIALNLVKPILLLFGAIDFLGATWTYLALRKAKT